MSTLKVKVEIAFLPKFAYLDIKGQPCLASPTLAVSFDSPSEISFPVHPSFFMKLDIPGVHDLLVKSLILL